MNKLYPVLSVIGGISIVFAIVTFSTIADNEFLISEYKQTFTYNPQDLPYGLYSEQLSNIRAPPPLELSGYGVPFDIFAKSNKNIPISSDNAGIPYSISVELADKKKLENAELLMIPSFIPENLEIKKTYYKSPEDGVKSVKLILLPQTVDKNDVLTLEDVYDYNGIFILISRQDFIFESEEEFEEWRDGIIGDHDHKKRTEINEWKGIASSGDPQKGKISSLTLLVPNITFQIQSSAYDISYLQQIAESMVR